MAESQYFKQQKKIGRRFEHDVETVLIEKGCTVIDSEKLKYRQKRGWDREVIIKGERAKVEIKLDAMSELTQNVCLELAALNQSISPIWIYGLPEQGRIDVYSMYLKDLKAFAEAWPNKRLVGEHSTPAALVAKSIFTSQPFIHKFKTLTQNKCSPSAKTRRSKPNVFQSNTLFSNSETNTV